MAFGVPASQNPNNELMQSVNDSGSVNVADLIDASGNPVDQTTYGATETVSEDYYLKSDETWENGATNGQTGSSVVTASSLISSNRDYQRVTQTTRKIPVSGGTT